MNDEPHVHTPPTTAEYQAALVIAPHLKKMKRDILAAVIKSGDEGLIPDQVPGLINTVRRRFTDLWKEGFIRPTANTRKNARGNPETVWVAGRDEKAVASSSSSPARIREAVLMLLKKNGGPIDGFVGGFGEEQVWTENAFVMVRREDFEALDKLTKGVS